MNNLENYDPSGVGQLNGNLFGLPFDRSSANLIVFAVPWEVTVSYNPGTALGPQQILNASPQLDLYDFDNPDGWKKGIFLEPIREDLLTKNYHYRELATKIITRLEEGKKLTDSPDLTPLLEDINQGCESVNHWLYDRCKEVLSMGKKVAVIGGDHSVPLGYFRALADYYADFGILHLDAHADLRDSYEGFQYSHASIMFNALHIPQISKIVQVGVRDICQDEVNLINSSSDRIIAYYDRLLKDRLYGGSSWQEICQEIVDHLPQNVHISFDVDGLDPKLCPHTGTPVPGGLELEQTFYLFRQLIKSGRKIIGFDICETGNAEWDGNVSARILYKIANLVNS
jgi:agmatinase